MKKIRNLSGFVFITSTVFLTFIAILGIWKILNDDVIGKSAKTIGLLAVVSVIIMVAGKFMDSKTQSTELEVQDINPAFSVIRRGTVAILVASVSLLALLGVLSIWNVLSGETLTRSFSSIAVIAFASVVIVLTCLEREHHNLMQKKLSGGMIVLIVVLAWMLFGLFRFL